MVRYNPRIKRILIKIFNIFFYLNTLYLFFHFKTIFVIFRALLFLRVNVFFKASLRLLLLFEEELLLLIKLLLIIWIDLVSQINLRNCIYLTIHQCILQHFFIILTYINIVRTLKLFLLLTAVIIGWNPIIHYILKVKICLHQSFT